jgi:hypothetical protein
VFGHYVGYGLVVADECHHIPAAGFEHAVKQIPARRWLGLTATPYLRDKLEGDAEQERGGVLGADNAADEAHWGQRTHPDPIALSRSSSAATIMARRHRGG